MLFEVIRSLCDIVICGKWPENILTLLRVSLQHTSIHTRTHTHTQPYPPDKASDRLSQLTLIKILMSFGLLQTREEDGTGWCSIPTSPKHTHTYLWCLQASDIPLCSLNLSGWSFYITPLWDGWRPLSTHALFLHLGRTLHPNCMCLDKRINRGTTWRRSTFTLKYCWAAAAAVSHGLAAGSWHLIVTKEYTWKERT